MEASRSASNIRTRASWSCVRAEDSGKGEGSWNDRLITRSQPYRRWVSRQYRPRRVRARWRDRWPFSISSGKFLPAPQTSLTSSREFETTYEPRIWREKSKKGKKRNAKGQKISDDCLSPRLLVRCPRNHRIHFDIVRRGWSWKSSVVDLCGRHEKSWECAFSERERERERPVSRPDKKPDGLVLLFVFILATSLSLNSRFVYSNFNRVLFVSPFIPVPGRHLARDRERNASSCTPRTSRVSEKRLCTENIFIAWRDFGWASGFSLTSGSESSLLKKNPLRRLLSWLFDFVVFFFFARESIIFYFNSFFIGSPTRKDHWPKIVSLTLEYRERIQFGHSLVRFDNWFWVCQSDVYLHFDWNAMFCSTDKNLVSIVQPVNYSEYFQKLQWVILIKLQCRDNKYFCNVFL